MRGGGVRRRTFHPPAGIRVGRIGGVELTLDYSWFIILFLIFVTFTTAIFPSIAPGLSRGTYLFQGAAGTLLFFASLLGHELAHSVVARRKGIEVEGITLFVFGGMARTRSEPSRPGDEFLIAAAGPAASLLFAVVSYGIGWTLGAGRSGPVLSPLFEHIGLLNLALALFNLLPGFPLDGGRLLRATLWRFSGDLVSATRIATTTGRLLGYGLVALGIAGALGGGSLLGGLWLVFIGWFLVNAASASYHQVLLQEVFRSLVAGDAMTPNPECVPPELPLDVLVHDFFLRRPFNSFPVLDGDELLGLVTLSQVKAVPRERWRELRTREVMTPLGEAVAVAPDTPMLEVLDLMNRRGVSRAMVVREPELVGIISSQDIARWMERAKLLD